jgi:hypothetical protein
MSSIAFESIMKGLCRNQSIRSFSLRRMECSLDNSYFTHSLIHTSLILILTHTHSLILILSYSYFHTRFTLTHSLTYSRSLHSHTSLILILIHTSLSLTYSLIHTSLILILTHTHMLVHIHTHSYSYTYTLILTLAFSQFDFIHYLIEEYTMKHLDDAIHLAEYLGSTSVLENLFLRSMSSSPFCITLYFGWICTHAHTHDLCTLCMSDNSIDCETAKIIALSLKDNTSLTTLDLSREENIKHIHIYSHKFTQ